MEDVTAVYNIRKSDADSLVTAVLKTMVCKPILGHLGLYISIFDSYKPRKNQSGQLVTFSNGSYLVEY